MFIIIFVNKKNQREAKSLVIHVTNKAGSFSKTTHITKYCKIQFAELSMEAPKAFNKSLKSEIWYKYFFKTKLNNKFARF